MGRKKIDIIRRGDIFFADLSPTIGSEQDGYRPVIIVQNDIGNHYSPTTIVVAISTKKINKILPTHVILHEKIEGLNTLSVAMVEQIRTIDKSRLLRPAGHLSEETMTKIEKALAISLALDCKKGKTC